MKQTIATLIFILLGMHSFAQDYDDKPREKTVMYTSSGKGRARCPKIYSTVSSGINNNTGLLGFSLDIPVARSVSVEGGVGIGTWGYKFCADAKYYLKPCHRGVAFGGGITYSTGLQNYEKSMETIYGTTEVVDLNLNPRTNVFIAAYRYWNMGRRYNRFYLEGGWSVPIPTGNLYDQLSGSPISNNSASVLRILSPGGLIFGFGFSFGGG